MVAMVAMVAMGGGHGWSLYTVQCSVQWPWVVAMVAMAGGHGR